MSDRDKYIVHAWNQADDALTELEQQVEGTEMWPRYKYMLLHISEARVQLAYARLALENK